MSKSNMLIKNFVYNTLYQILLLITPLIITPYISRVIGAAGIGVYSYAQSFATYFVLIGAVGTNLYGQREIAYVQNDSVKRTEVFWEITIFRIITVFLCTIVYYLIFGLHGKYPAVYKILTLEVLAAAFDISWFFMGMENFRLTVIRNTVIKLCGIIMVFLFVKTPDDVPLYTFCLTLPVFIGNISLWFGVKKYLVKLSSLVVFEIFKHIKPIFILFLPQIATEVYTVLDKTMIGVLGSDIAQVGYYTQAQKIVKIILSLVTSLGTVMLPMMSAAFSQGKDEQIQKNIKAAFRFVLMLAMALFFGLIGIAEQFVPVFFGEGYDQVIPLIIVISPILMIIGISNVIGKQYLLPTKQQKAYTISIMTGAGINFLLNIILIPFCDAIGASIATLIAEITVTCVQIWYVRKQIPLGECFKPLGKYFVLGAVMFLVIREIGRTLPDGVISLTGMILAGIVTYMLELVITKDEMFQSGLKMIRKKRGCKNMDKTEIQTDRDCNIDLIHILACMAVVGLHTFPKDLSVCSSSAYYICGFAIPFFFMASGYFLLNRGAVGWDYSIRKVCRILRVVICWNGIAVLLKYSMQVLMHKKAVFNIMMVPTECIKSLAQKGIMWQFWYMGAMIILYLLLPVLSGISRRNKRILMFLSGIIAVAFEIGSIIHGKALQSYIIQTFRLWTWIFYFLLGGEMITIKKVLSQKLAVKMHALVTGIATVMIVIYQDYVGWNIIISAKAGEWLRAEYFYDSIFEMLWVGLLFTLLLRIDITGVKFFVRKLAPLTMGIYILHPKVLRLTGIVIGDASLCRAMLYWIVSFTLSCIIVWIINKLLFGKYLIKI